MNNGLQGLNSKKPLSALKSYFYSLVNRAGINLSTTVYALIPDTSDPNVDIALISKGNGALIQSIPDGTIVGGNKRGARSTDLQGIGARTAATQVASGADSLTAGNSNTASNTQSVALGLNNNAAGTQAIALGSGNGATAAQAVAVGAGNTASGTQSFAAGNTNISSGVQSIALGGSNTASGPQSFAVGGNGSASGAYSFTFARFGLTNGRSSSYAFGTEGSVAAGRQQGIGIGLVMTTTGATPTRATANNAAASTANQLTLQNNSTVYVLGHVLARDTVTNDVAYWEVKAVAKRGAAAANTTILGTPSVTKLFADTAAATWTITISADTTNGALAIDVTGAGTNAIRWHAQLDGNEVA